MIIPYRTCSLASQYAAALRESTWLGLIIAMATSHAVQADYDVVSLSVTNSYVAENAGSITVSVVRAGSGVGACAVGFKTVAETAFPVRDYIPVTGRVEFASGHAQAELTVSLISNTVPDPTRFFQVVLVDSSNCVLGVAVTGAVAILDAQTVETMAQDFESGVPPGWGITTNADTNGYWRFDGLEKGYWANTTGGRGNYAIADNCYYIEPMDTELRLPSFPAAATALTYLVFKTDYYAGGFDTADVDVSASGEDGPWTNRWRKQYFDYSGPVTEIIDLTQQVRGRSNVVVRFHYYNATNEWYWQIDDVAILVEPDSNTNGLPDWWETAYYSGLTNLPPCGDSDRDGACNEDEFIAGTNPRETGSCFRVEGMICSNANRTVAFDAVMAHFYDLLVTTNLMEQAWTNGEIRIQGMGGHTNISLESSGPTGFYRLNVNRL